MSACGTHLLVELCARRLACHRRILALAERVHHFVDQIDRVPSVTRARTQERSADGDLRLTHLRAGLGKVRTIRRIATYVCEILRQISARIGIFPIVHHVDQWLRRLTRHGSDSIEQREALLILQLLLRFFQGAIDRRFQFPIPDLIPGLAGRAAAADRWTGRWKAASTAASTAASASASIVVLILKPKSVPTLAACAHRSDVPHIGIGPHLSRPYGLRRHAARAFRLGRETAKV